MLELLLLSGESFTHGTDFFAAEAQVVRKNRKFSPGAMGEKTSGSGLQPGQCSFRASATLSGLKPGSTCSLISGGFFITI